MGYVGVDTVTATAVGNQCGSLPTRQIISRSTGSECLLLAVTQSFQGGDSRSTPARLVHLAILSPGQGEKRKQRPADQRSPG